MMRLWHLNRLPGNAEFGRVISASKHRLLRASTCNLVGTPIGITTSGQHSTRTGKAGWGANIVGAGKGAADNTAVAL